MKKIFININSKKKNQNYNNFLNNKILIKKIFFLFIDVAASVDVHFENKDGGFFLKHSPRQYYSSSSRQETMTPISSTVTASPPGSVLSIDKFTVFQTSEPVSVRATYGPFSTKQTVPARYIVPDPLDTLPLPDPRNRGPNNNNNTTTSSLAMSRALLDAQELGTRHLDMSAHLVSNTVARDSPVLRYNNQIFKTRFISINSFFFCGSTIIYHFILNYIFN